ncbi:GNAT family N-acetyltransferase [Methylobacterium sp. WCS2018Hpa-22]|uniref:GNAT family N-acetyltransferase n=1 Tax=Methylobacterium sp. WCS2018Hpa-22 TaxID=3073633 RepID=UPI00288C3F32|nr:GNAT family N-acetyltransferase [Methylobacterium sp. WCS2018Hpa-22]
MSRTDIALVTLPPPLAADQLSCEAAEALAFILPLSTEYPNIEEWFCGKVAPGIQNGTRHLLRIERDGRLVGLGIAKSSPFEKKICTVRIAPEYVGKGLGVRIFDGLLHWLGTDQPHLTVSEKKLPAYERIFEWYGFKLTSKSRGLYLPSVTEVRYNDPSRKLNSTISE